MWTLFGLDSDLAREAIDWHLKWLNAWPLWLVIVAVAGGIAYVWQLYRHESSRLGRVACASFTALRALAIAILLAMIFEPAVVWDIPAEKDSRFLVLVDDSQSMGVADRYEKPEQLQPLVRMLWPGDLGNWEGTTVAELPEDRREALRALTRAGLVNRVFGDNETNLLDPLADVFNLQVFTFSETLKPVGDADNSVAVAADVTPEVRAPKVTIEPEGKMTRAGDLLRQAVLKSRGRVAGVLLVSDGISNVGEDLASTAVYLKGRNIPVYAVGVGDPSPLRDVAIRNFNANRIALVDDIVTMDFELESKGFASERVDVQLLRDGQSVEVINDGRPTSTASFVLEEKIAERDGEQVVLPQPSRLSFRAEKPGEFTYTLQVRERPEELIVENNSASLPIRVIEQKIQVLYVEGRPRWEYRYLKNAFLRDETIKVSCYLSAADFDFPQEGDIPISLIPDKAEDLAKYDLIILGDVPRNQFTDAQLRLFKDFVEELGGGLLMQAGPWHNPVEYRGTIIEKMLPVDLEAAVESTSRPTVETWFPRLTREGETHPMTRFETDVDANSAFWKRLPGFNWHFAVARARPGALVLLEHPTDTSSYGPHPLLATQYYGTGKAAFLAFDSTWRWRGLIGDRYFVKFWGQVVRDLTQSKLIGSSKRFRVGTDRSEYRAGEQVTVTARVLDREFKPSQASEVHVRLEGDAGERLRLKLDAVGGEEGNFRGTTVIRRPGTWRVRLDMIEPGVDVDTMWHQFLVVRSVLEFENPSMRRAELQRLAENTGGQYFDIAQASAVPAALRRLKAATIREVSDEFWNAPIFFAVFCLLFVTELLWRKRRKML